MIEVDCEQGSPEWFQARLGLPTASGFRRILTPSTLALAAGRVEYLRELVAERVLGRPANEDAHGGAWAERGLHLEAQAVRAYERSTGRTTRAVGFCRRDDRLAGCSPDRLVGEDGGLEVKTPAAKTHVGYLLDPDLLVKDYGMQVQGSLWVTGRAWWDLVSWNPGLREVRIRIAPSEAYVAAFDEHLPAFVREIEDAVKVIDQDDFCPI